MPCLKIFTNVPKTQIPLDFVEKIVPILSKTVGKPHEKFICMVSGDCSLSFLGNNTSPSAVATLESIGNIDPIRNKAVSKEISEYIAKTIGVKPEKFFLTFYDLKKSDVGLAGTTVEELER